MTQAIRRFMLFEATTFVVAALIHFGVLAHGFEHQKAGIAESVIATVLLTGFAWSVASRRSSRLIGLIAQGFALLGTLVGVFTIAIGVGPRTVPDVAYHVLIVIVLISGLVVAARSPKGAP
jgi:dolichyl-phosphate-mannose--protein O-mannosyl transferase